MRNPFKKADKPQNNNPQNIVDVAKELVTHGSRGGLVGINVATDNLIFTEVFNWAKRHKERGENITKDVLVAKMNKEFHGNPVFKKYSEALGYNDVTINKLADDVIANL